VGLALCGSSSPDDQALIDQVLLHAGEGEFARAFLKAKGVTHVDEVFDAFAAPALAAE
jgi:type IV secretion system protein VirB4